MWRDIVWQFIVNTLIDCFAGYTLRNYHEELQFYADSVGF